MINGIALFFLTIGNVSALRIVNERGTAGKEMDRQPEFGSRAEKHDISKFDSLHAAHDDGKEETQANEEQDYSKKPKKKISHQPPMDENSWIELDGASYMASFEEHAAKYPEACQSPIDDDKKCPAERLNKVFANSLGWDSKGLLKRLAGKTVLFFGDSMVRQVFTRSVCMYAEHIVDLKYNLRYKDQWHKVTFRVDEQNVTFLNKWFSHPPKVGSKTGVSVSDFKELVGTVDISVLSTGAFQTTETSMLGAVKLYHRLLSKVGGKLLYLEYPATHFPSPSGDYEDSIYYNPKHDHKLVATHIDFNKNPDSYICQPMDYDAWKASAVSYRVFTGNAYFQNNSVPIMYQFNATKPIHEQHKGGIDCRHFCNPSPVLDMQIYKLDETMKELLE